MSSTTGGSFCLFRWRQVPCRRNGWWTDPYSHRDRHSLTHHTQSLYLDPHLPVPQPKDPGFTVLHSGQTNVISPAVKRLLRLFRLRLARASSLAPVRRFQVSLSRAQFSVTTGLSGLFVQTHDNLVRLGLLSSKQLFWPPHSVVASVRNRPNLFPRPPAQTPDS
ncbi:hypothetical protein TgHK011_007434 [Trichoderma gracile]|nr:hypothetical protein TgHK011_007434 [Trichoderma gracile]